jgi:hypothetical protein
MERDDTHANAAGPALAHEARTNGTTPGAEPGLTKESVDTFMAHTAADCQAAIRGIAAAKTSPNEAVQIDRCIL